MTYEESIEFLYGLQTFGMKFGLRGIRTLLRHTGNPHRSLRCVHIAGTNGKGSTAAMVAAVLTAAGHRTALYTSPHLVSFEERMRIDGKPIPRATVARLVRELKPAILGHRSTFFEAVTAMAFRWFAEEEVDIAVIETGLGGRLDATNVLTPLVSVITSIDLEHTSILGSTLRAIAREKAGIIKRRVPCVSGVHQPKARDVVKSTCRQLQAPLRSNDSVRHCARSWGWEGTQADFSFGRTHLRGMRIAFPGAHQLENVATALLVVEELRKRHGFRIPPSAVRRGLRRITALTGLRGRLTVVRKRPLVVADVAHNPAAMGILSGALDDLHAAPAVFVLGVMRDKDLSAMARQLAPCAAQVIAVSARTDRSLPAGSVARVFERSGIPVEEARSVSAGVRRALRLAKGRPVVITGSHFVVGEALAMLEGRNYLTINQ